LIDGELHIGTALGERDVERGVSGAAADLATVARSRPARSIERVPD